jgi:transposase
MPQKDFILNLPGFTIKKVSGYLPLILDVHYRRKARCLFCQGKQLRKKASFIRHVKHESVGHRPMILRFKAYKFYCGPCHRYFNQQFPGIGKHQRATERLQNQIFHQHTQGISGQTLAHNFRLGKATVERWFHQRYLLENRETLQKKCPRILGLDEHSFSKKKGYATTFCDLAQHNIFDVVPGKSSADLSGYLNHLPGKERVKVVCIDLSISYRNIVRQHFPNAMIVADRFHVIRLVNHMSMQTYQSIDPHIKYQRGILNALRTNPDNLKPHQVQKRDQYFRHQPAIAAVYAFKQKLHRLLMIKHRQAKKCKRLIKIFLDYIQQLKESRFSFLNSLGKTLWLWRDEIVRMWRFTKNNGITEGFHRKMKLIQRRAYGFRNFENYRLRVKVLCA